MAWAAARHGAMRRRWNTRGCWLRTVQTTTLACGTTPAFEVWMRRWRRWRRWSCCSRRGQCRCCGRWCRLRGCCSLLSVGSPCCCAENNSGATAASTPSTAPLNANLLPLRPVRLHCCAGRRPQHGAESRALQRHRWQETREMGKWYIFHTWALLMGR